MAKKIIWDLETGMTGSYLSEKPDPSNPNNVIITYSPHNKPFGTKEAAPIPKSLRSVKICNSQVDGVPDQVVVLAPRTDEGILNEFVSEYTKKIERLETENRKLRIANASTDAELKKSRSGMSQNIADMNKAIKTKSSRDRFSSYEDLLDEL